MVKRAWKAKTVSLMRLTVKSPKLMVPTNLRAETEVDILLV